MISVPPAVEPSGGHDFTDQGVECHSGIARCLDVSITVVSVQERDGQRCESRRVIGHVTAQSAGDRVLGVRFDLTGSVTKCDDV